LPVAQDDRRKSADQVGAHVRWIVEFLRNQERPLKE
jgi:hypothetical protein